MMPRTRAAAEDGWALVTAIAMMVMMMTFSLATMTMVDNEQHQSAAGRQRETAFNLAEAALNAQIYSLTTHWPGAGGATNANVAEPTSCTPSSSDVRCPTPSTLSQLFASADTDTGSSWTTMVRDNSGATGAATFWTEGMINGAPRYDANGDGRMWVRSQAVAKGHTRTMVALVRTEQQSETIPHDTLLSGRLSISNEGRKRIIDTKGTSASTGPVVVRCTPQSGESSPCLGHTVDSGGLSSLYSLLDVQISPAVATTGYAGGSGLSPDALERLRQAAIANGTYYTYCPSSLTGAVVYIDTITTCSYSGNSQFNSASAPGVLIVANGPLSLAGTVNFYGLVYHANLSNSTDWLIQLGGNAQVTGGVAVDGEGGVVAGSSKENVVFSDAAFQAVRSYGTAGLIQNTWRELVPGS